MKQLVDIIARAIGEALQDTHTATIGRVVKVDAKTIDVQPVINTVFKGKDTKLTVFSKVPPVFLQGGGSYTAHPIAIGDYALLVFSERSFDNWYAGYDEVPPPELRMHDYSDGFAVVGINPFSSAITIPSVITQIGDTYQEGAYEHLGSMTRTGNENVTGDRAHTGSIAVTDTIQAATSVLGNASFTTIQTGGLSGVSGTFTTADAKTVTVTNGIITSIV